jgi:hypothetical protein
MGRFTRLIDKIKHMLARDRRRFPRYEFKATEDLKTFYSVEGIAAYLQNPATGVEQPHPIINLSEGGIALFLVEGEDPDTFKEHPKLVLKLHIYDQLLNLPCTVVYAISGLRRMGLKFSRLTKEQREAIIKFLDVRFLADSLKEIPVKEQRRDMICRWHHGMNNTEMFTWETRNGHIHSHLLIFVDRAVAWSEKQGIRTGRVRKQDFALSYTALYSNDPNPIDFDKEIDIKTIDTAHKIIELAVIDPVLKQHFLDHIKKNY